MTPHTVDEDTIRELLDDLNRVLALEERRWPYLMVDPEGFYFDDESPGYFCLDIQAPVWTQDEFMSVRMRIALYAALWPAAYTRRRYVKERLQNVWDLVVDYQGQLRWGTKPGVSPYYVTQLAVEKRRERGETGHQYKNYVGEIASKRRVARKARARRKAGQGKGEE